MRCSSAAACWPLPPYDSSAKGTMAQPARAHAAADVRLRDSAALSRALGHVELVIHAQREVRFDFDMVAARPGQLSQRSLDRIVPAPDAAALLQLARVRVVGVDQQCGRLQVAARAAHTQHVAQVVVGQQTEPVAYSQHVLFIPKAIRGLAAQRRGAQPRAGRRVECERGEDRLLVAAAATEQLEPCSRFQRAGVQEARLAAAVESDYTAGHRCLPLERGSKSAGWQAQSSTRQICLGLTW
jgi:hypothetical protein